MFQFFLLNREIVCEFVIFFKNFLINDHDFDVKYRNFSQKFQNDVQHIISIDWRWWYSKNMKHRFHSFSFRRMRKQIDDVWHCWCKFNVDRLNLKLFDIQSKNSKYVEIAFLELYRKKIRNWYESLKKKKRKLLFVRSFIENSLCVFDVFYRRRFSIFA